MIGYLRKKRLKKVMEEKQSLPLGRKDFEEWSSRVIALAAIPGVTKESQQFALCRMLLDLKPTIAFESDAYFAHCLRKAAVNQVADAIFKELHEARKAKADAEGVASS